MTSSGEVPVHRRSIELDAFERDGGIEVVARLQDRRPWADGTTSPEVLHDMELRVVVRTADLVISDAVAVMHRFPHAECPAIEPVFTGLIGLSIARGYTREVQRRFGGVSGCSHLEHLARSVGPVVVQAVASTRARKGNLLRGEADRGSGDGAAWLRDTCHIWAEGGVGEQKLRIGWRPGRGAYPAASLQELRAGDRGDAGE